MFTYINVANSPGEHDAPSIADCPPESPTVDDVIGTQGTFYIHSKYSKYSAIINDLVIR